MGGQGAYDWGGQGAPAMFKNSTGVNVNTVAAAGTTLATGGVITFGSGLWDVTAGDGTKGVTLPVPTGWNGAKVVIYNHSASNLKVYPHSGGDINDGSTDAAVTVAANVFAEFASVDGTTWSAMYTAGGTYATLTGSETLTNKTLTAPIINTPTIADPIFTGQKYSTAITYTSNTTLAPITGLTGFTLTAGATYVFEGDIKITCTTTGGLALAFKYTTATVTALNVSSTLSAVIVNGGYLSTTTTDEAKFVDNKTAAWLIGRISGTLVVGTGGTVAVEAAQNTSAGGGDVTTILAGSWFRFTRVS